MRFLYPWGLLGLLGIPILIIVYIIKSKYTEETVSSTYLWNLSEKFLKKRRRKNPLAGMISLLLQILAVTAVSLAIAHPVFLIPQAAHEYCFVLDASGSMSMELDGKTRFDIGKEKIAEIIDSASEGSVYTLVRAEDGAHVVYERLGDKEEALALLSEQTVSAAEADLSKALARAQAYFNADRSVKTYLVTDSSYRKTKNVELINVARGEKNLALDEITYDILYSTDPTTGETTSLLRVEGTALSYTADASVTVSLLLDGAQRPCVEKELTLHTGEPTAFLLEVAGVDHFASMQVALSGRDASSSDNIYTVFDVHSEDAYKTLLVSNNPFLIETALRALGYTQIDWVEPGSYDGQSGYGLYIFDEFSPEECPDDGAVWMIAPDGSLSDAGFSVQGEVTPDGGALLRTESSSSSILQMMTEGLLGNEVFVSEYIKCGLYRNFTTVMTCEGNPVLFVGTNDHGNRQIVMAFSLHKSNLALLTDYLPLLRNMLEYSFPTPIERVNYYCGEELTVNVIPNCESIRIDSPLGNVSYLDTGSAMSSIRLDEAGVWRVTLMVGGTQRVFSAYASPALSERDPRQTAESFSVSGTPEKSVRDGIYDVLLIVLICLSVLVVADWMVYCYEKYQLR